MPITTVAGMPCDFCGEVFDPISTRWLCPHCHAKANCCDGAPLPVRPDAEVAGLGAAAG